MAPLALCVVRLMLAHCDLKIHVLWKCIYCSLSHANFHTGIHHLAIFNRSILVSPRMHRISESRMRVCTHAFLYAHMLSYSYAAGIQGLAFVQT
jgi:hypothetical protein